MENRNVYKGHRYVPKIMGVWDQLKSYEGLSIVTWEGTSYTSKKRVPEGVEITNEDYWVVTGNYNAQVENYRQDVVDYRNEVVDYKEETTDHINEVDEKLTTQLAQTKIKLDGRTSIGIHEFEDYIQDKELNDREDWDWSDALQAAFDYLVSIGTGGRIMFGNQRYLFNKMPNIYNPQNYNNEGIKVSSRVYGGALSNIEIVGQSMEKTFIIQGVNNKNGLFNPVARENESKNLFNITFKDITLVGNNYQGTAFKFSDTTNPYYLFFTNVRFTKFDVGFEFKRSLGYGFTNFTNCFFENNNVGFDVGGDNTLFENCTVQRNRGYGGKFERLHACTFIGGKVQYNAMLHDTSLGDEQFFFSNCDNISFKGTYFEPTHSTTPEGNEGKSFFQFYNYNTQETSNIVFDNCYFNGNKSGFLATISGNSVTRGLKFTDCLIHNFKLISGGSLLNQFANSILENVIFDQSNTIKNMFDKDDKPTNNWRISGAPFERVKSLTPASYTEYELNGGKITKIVGAVSADGSQKYFGRTYTVEKIDVGSYKIILPTSNVGVISGNPVYFPVLITPFASNENDDIHAIARRDTNSEFFVYIRDSTGDLVDKGFSFEVTMSVI